MIKVIVKYFDKLEDRVRGKLSRKPIAYAFIGGAGVVLFWRGVWHTMDFLMSLLAAELPTSEIGSVDIGTLPWWDGPISILMGSVLLLMSGIFVSSFIGNEVILSGLKGEKKVFDKAEIEIKKEVSAIKGVQQKVEKISRQVEELDKTDLGKK